ncbi:MAG: NAD(P)-binding domain-containing protein [Anaerolineae bacterium]|jgi:cation diffusion facilitator CzcD-associated flavoprotein CzcO|nr:NAD(P)-binding domain-containing protein [Anaerolineae bacterium]
MDNVCIIGAGSSGIVAAKILHQRGIPFDCYEKGSGIGGNWRYRNDNGMSSAYRTLHINTSKTRMAYSDYPMPDDYPDYPHHSDILTYFEKYVDHFGFRDRITFQTAVERVEPQANGGYLVHLSDGRVLPYRSVIVANGHHWSPRWPTPAFPGSERFEGVQMHAHDYKEPEPLIGKRVLVLGIGNSGVDIACDTARVGERVFLASRRGAHVIPKYILGMPTDLMTNSPVAYMPLWVQQWSMKLLVWIGRGSQKRYGVPVPDYPILSEHPTISSDLLHYVGHGKVRMKPNISEIKPHSVRFTDGSEETIDVIIYATGYNVCFPFFDANFIEVSDNFIPLYQHVVHPDHPGLYFVGLVQPLGAIMPLAELQSQWIAQLLTNESLLPSREAMYQAIQQRRDSVARQYISSPRHTIQVNYATYARDLEQEIKKKFSESR